ncbi:MIT domain-containing protein 1-like [Amphibalanus amphitrite]|uniref:MIT domain-containing protein 1-like n=1 Tax=Amphibalanus amphitrite TaxID=1232801 RepID=UPI001C9134C2|nr:MIT domain-containing protein 1-like [Amphibalanus amphitrite]XP_043242845.1 MIT domain-containing protein 1-like [Amphibalanus amphitrite]XP_043242846.1 MIT domain-containing protein 1-like [Amphibalanus amphitrite]
MDGLEAAAVSVLKRAVELDTKRRWTESMTCYQEGLHLLMEVIKGLPEGPRRSAFRTKATEYMDRAEKLKTQIEAEKRLGKYHEQLHIDEDSTGHSYESVFGRFLDSAVTVVEVEDPYIRAVHQCYNFLRLCELCVRKCPRLRQITLLTGSDPGDADVQRERLNKIGASLSERGVKLAITFSETLHDREIRINNGWIIKIGRGLSYFKPPASKFCLGYNDLDLRPCQETTVDIIHKAASK